MIKAVIFDMDGLIIDSEPLWRKSEMEVFHSMGYHFTEEMCIQTMGMRINEVVKYWHDQFGWKSHSIKEVIDNIQDKLIENVKNHGKALEGVDTAIEYLNKRNILTAIASSSSFKIIAAVTEKLKLKDKFNIIHSAENEIEGKPHPAVFLSTSDKLGVKPEECIVLEDSKFGMQAGLHAGMKVIVIPEKGTQPDWIKNANYHYSSLSEINWKDHIS